MKLKSGRSSGTGLPGKVNWNGEVIVLDELEVIEEAGDDGRGGEASRLGKPII